MKSAKAKEEKSNNSDFYSKIYRYVYLIYCAMEI